MIIFGIVLFFVLIAVDQATKLWARSFLMPVKSFTVIKGILDFTYVENRGAAFGIFSGKTGILAIISLAAVIGIMIYYFKLPKTPKYKYLRVSLILIAAGAVGNLIDRVFMGYVTDFIEVTFISYPVFNFADICVCVGAVLFAFLVLFVIKDDE